VLKAAVVALLAPSADKGIPRLRVLYMGKEIPDTSYIGSMVGVDSGRVVQCFITFRPA